MAEEDSKEQPVVEKKSRKRLLGVLVTSVLIAGIGVAGTLLGPRLLGEGEEVAPEGSASAEPEEDVTPPNSMAFQPVVVDVRDKDSLSHHMRVGISVELEAGVGKDEFDKLMPRGREAVIAYLRSKPFEDLTAPQQFDVIVKELGNRVSKAMGPSHTKRIVITDYVVQ